uniref:Uncharacterized protein n=1 Tax=Denticeps clupeoides TaxID=299321 RepID=A0AAY4D447_9TELE
PAATQQALQPGQLIPRSHAPSFHSALCLEYSSLEYSGLEYSGLEYSSLEYSSLEYSGLEYSGSEYSSLEYSGLEYSAGSGRGIVLACHAADVAGRCVSLSADPGSRTDAVSRRDLDRARRGAFVQKNQQQHRNVR